MLLFLYLLSLVYPLYLTHHFRWGAYTIFYAIIPLTTLMVLGEYLAITFRSPLESLAKIPCNGA